MSAQGATAQETRDADQIRAGCARDLACHLDGPPQADAPAVLRNADEMAELVRSLDARLPRPSVARSLGAFTDDETGRSRPMSGKRVRSARQPPAQVDPGDALIAVAALTLVKFTADGGCGLLAEHASDDSGHCRACYSSRGVSPVWPCILWTIARQAQVLASERQSPAPTRRAAHDIAPTSPGRPDTDATA